jgi:acyl-CoA synthetase (AMP-forming)/AMP-acid ligase II
MDQTTGRAAAEPAGGYLGDDGPSIRPLPRRVWCQPIADAIFAHVRRKPTLYQRIRRIKFINAPRTISGKIRRIDLRARENACEADGLTQEYRAR